MLLIILHGLDNLHFFSDFRCDSFHPNFLLFKAIILDIITMVIVSNTTRKAKVKKRITEFNNFKYMQTQFLYLLIKYAICMHISLIYSKASPNSSEQEINNNKLIRSFFDDKIRHFHLTFSLFS